jgi:hypothetical protein
VYIFHKGSSEELPIEFNQHLVRNPYSSATERSGDESDKACTTTEFENFFTLEVLWA